MRACCVCPCHRSSILTAFHGADIMDPVEAVTACDSCLRIHCRVLLEKRVWIDAPEPSPYRDEPPTPVNFCDQSDGEGPE